MTRKLLSPGSDLLGATFNQVMVSGGARQAAIDEWARNYRVAFREVADPDCGVDPDADGDRFRFEYWHSLTREQREERIANPSEGAYDGRKDANGLNGD